MRTVGAPEVGDAEAGHTGRGEFGVGVKQSHFFGGGQTGKGVFNALFDRLFGVEVCRFGGVSAVNRKHSRGGSKDFFHKKDN